MDVCSLVPRSKAAELIGRKLEVVGVRVGAARLETVRCEFGLRFADPVLSVALTTDPVAERVFESASAGTKMGGAIEVSARVKGFGT